MIQWQFQFQLIESILLHRIYLPWNKFGKDSSPSADSFLIRARKRRPGEHFADLQMVTKLLAAPSPKAPGNLIEVLSKFLLSSLLPPFSSSLPSAPPHGGDGPPADFAWRRSFWLLRRSTAHSAWLAPKSWGVTLRVKRRGELWSLWANSGRQRAGKENVPRSIRCTVGYFLSKG